MESRHKSRRRTPWDKNEELSPTQEFLKMHYLTRYEERHPTIAGADEAAMINSYLPEKCPFCGSQSFSRIGFDANGMAV